MSSPLAELLWPCDYSASHVRQALLRTTNISPRDGTRLIGCVRILTDGYFFGTIPEILVDPDHFR